MKCDFCKRFTTALYEFEEGTGWYCNHLCFLAATTELDLDVEQEEQENKEENKMKCE
jgi:hypothetical protein